MIWLMGELPQTQWIACCAGSEEVPSALSPPGDFERSGGDVSDGDPLVESLERAVEAAPDDLTLRLHLAQLLVDRGRGDQAIPHLATILTSNPDSVSARSLMARVVSGAASKVANVGSGTDGSDVSSRSAVDRTSPERVGFNWAQAEEELGGAVPPRFVDGDADEPLPEAFDVERSAVRLADVGGMEQVKARLEAAFLAPMRNPELGALYGRGMRGGLLLYGPPGCGKSFIARAVAGELGAQFIAISLADVLDMYIGQSERNLHEVFQLARRSAPCVLFLDEVDAIGQKRSQLRGGAMRGTVNQLLSEMDSVGSVNEGVFVLAATNHPWDVDVALRRPGRFDRTLLVLPPDEPAREAILRYHVRDRPIGGIDVGLLARRTDGFSGADLAHLVDVAAEGAMLDAAASGVIRLIEMGDFDRALREVRPSVRPWLETARNVAMFANAAGEYDELVTYLKKRR